MFKTGIEDGTRFPVRRSRGAKALGETKEKKGKGKGKKDEEGRGNVADGTGRPGMVPEKRRVDNGSGKEDDGTDDAAPTTDAGRVRDTRAGQSKQEEEDETKVNRNQAGLGRRLSAHAQTRDHNTKHMEGTRARARAWENGRPEERKSNGAQRYSSEEDRARG